MRILDFNLTCEKHKTYLVGSPRVTKVKALRYTIDTSDMWCIVGMEKQEDCSDRWEIISPPKV